LALCQYTPDRRVKKMTRVKKITTKTMLVRIERTRKMRDRTATKMRKKANDEVKPTVSRPADSLAPAGA
jgi:hypothetical protein